MYMKRKLQRNVENAEIFWGPIAPSLHQY